ncbi:MAG: nucleotidyl transferase AbiEii/AbiGii toxin family protein [Desulfobacterales bacterium]|jgi:hypothetical protein
MTKNSEYEEKVISYEHQLSRSFNFVIREAEQLYQGQGRLRKTYDRLTKRLEALGVAYGVVGGYALIVYGVRRFTEDIDVLVSGEGLDRLHKQLVGLGYVRVAPGSRNLRDVETGVKIEFIVTGEFPGDGEPKPVAFPAPEAVVERREGIKVINLKSLIELKLASGMTAKGRLQDLADVQRLIQENGLNVEFAKELNAYVQDKFLELLS